MVLFLGVGNASTATGLKLLDDAWPVLCRELGRDDAGVVMLERDRIALHRRA